MNQKKGIWIQRDRTVRLPNLSYNTCLQEIEDLVAFVPFEHNFDSSCLGIISYADLGELTQNTLGEELLPGANQGLFQTQFYPLGDIAELRGKGLAQRIELEIAKDISNIFPEKTQIVIGGSSKSHLKYCARIGFEQFKPISLKEYLALLSKNQVERK